MYYITTSSSQHGFFVIAKRDSLFHHSYLRTTGEWKQKSSYAFRYFESMESAEKYLNQYFEEHPEEFAKHIAYKILT